LCAGQSGNTAFIAYTTKAKATYTIAEVTFLARGTWPSTTAIDLPFGTAAIAADKARATLGIAGAGARYTFAVDTQFIVATAIVAGIGDLTAVFDTSLSGDAIGIAAASAFSGGSADTLVTDQAASAIAIADTRDTGLA
jgi:hypothetical protein